MPDYKYADIVSGLVIKGGSPIGNPPSGNPLTPLDAGDLCEIIDDGIAGKYDLYGGLYFHEFEISGLVNLCNRKIPFPIYFEHCIFHDFLELWSSEFRSFSLSGSTLESGADMRSSVFKGGLYLRNGFTCKGKLLLRDISVTQTIDFQDASFLFDGDDGSDKSADHNGECVSLSRAKANALYWRRLPVKPRGKVNFRDVSVASFQNDIEADVSLDNWPDEGKLILEGFKCENMTDVSPIQALKWLDLQENISISSLANIAKIYEKQHQSQNYNKIVAEIRKKEISQIKQPFIRFIHTLFFFIIGYGASPQRALYILLAAIIIHLAAIVTVANSGGIGPNINEMLSDPCFTGLSEECKQSSLDRYKEIQISINGGTQTRYVPQQYPDFNALLFTTESFLPFIDTGQKRYWEVSSISARVILSVFSPIAFFLSGLFLGSIAGLLDKKL